MEKIRYYYNPILKSNDGRYTVDYFCSDGKTSIWSGSLNGNTYEEVLSKVKHYIMILNAPRPLFGRKGRIAQWFWWRKQIRNQKKSTTMC